METDKPYIPAAQTVTDGGDLHQVRGQDGDQKIPRTLMETFGPSHRDLNIYTPVRMAQTLDQAALDMAMGQAHLARQTLYWHAARMIEGMTFDELHTGITHSQGCWSFGRRHYQCALNEIMRLRQQPVQDGTHMNEIAFMAVHGVTCERMKEIADGLESSHEGSLVAHEAAVVIRLLAGVK